MKFLRKMEREYYSNLSYLEIDNNNFKKSKISLNYAKRRQTIKFYPSFDLDYLHYTCSDSFSDCQRSIKNKNIKIHHKFSFLKRSKRHLRRNRLKILLLKQNTIQIWAVHKNFETVRNFLGTFILLKSNLTTKTIIISPWKDHRNLKEFSFYFSTLSNEIDLTFFDKLKYYNSIDEKRKYFISKISRSLRHLDFSNVFLELLEKSNNNKLKNFMIFESPFDYNLSINNMPKIDLNIQTFRRDKEILLFSLPSSFKKKFRDNLTNKLSVYSEKHLEKIKQSLIYSKEFLVNYGSILENQTSSKDEKLKFEASIEYGGVGSLIYDINNLRHPLGLNLGKDVDDDIFLNFDSEEIKKLLREYLQETDCFYFK